jgi:hypothetical protein
MGQLVRNDRDPAGINHNQRVPPVVQVWTNGEIAEQLHRGVRTVTWNRTQIRAVWEQDLAKWDRLAPADASYVS